MEHSGAGEGEDDLHGTGELLDRGGVYSIGEMYSSSCMLERGGISAHVMPYATPRVTPRDRSSILTFCDLDIFVADR